MSLARENATTKEKAIKDNKIAIKSTADKICGLEDMTWDHNLDNYFDPPSPPPTPKFQPLIRDNVDKAKNVLAAGIVDET